MRGYRNSNVRMNVWAEVMKVSGERVLQAVLERRTHLGGDLGGRTGTPGNLSLFAAALIRGRIWNVIQRSRSSSRRTNPGIT